MCSVHNSFFSEFMLGIMEEPTASVFISSGIVLSKNKMLHAFVCVIV
jgi:hypothetical protein